MTWPHLLTALLRRGTIAEPPRMTADVRWAIAVHEAAHVVVGVIAFGHRSAVVSSTIEDSACRGMTRWEWEEMDSHTITGQHQVNRAITALAGMAGERELLGAPTMGSGIDVDNATEIVMTLVRYGLADEWGVLGLDKLAPDDRGNRLRERYNEPIDLRLSEDRRLAEAIARANVEAIRTLATRLEAVGHLAGDNLQLALSEALVPDSGEG